MALYCHVQIKYLSFQGDRQISESYIYLLSIDSTEVWSRQICCVHYTSLPWRTLSYWTIYIFPSRRHLQNILWIMLFHRQPLNCIVFISLLIGISVSSQYIYNVWYAGQAALLACYNYVYMYIRSVFHIPQHSTSSLYLLKWWCFKDDFGWFCIIM